MKNKKVLLGMLVIVLVFTMTGTRVFAQEEHKHQPFDVLIGLNFGFGISPNMFDLFKSLSDKKAPQGNYALIFDYGVTCDFYLFNWLSFNTGLLLHPDIYLLLDQDLSGDYEITDIAATPLCLTIPLAVHVNIPKVEWLYTGIGLSFNIPLFGMVDSTVKSIGGVEVDTKGDAFIGMPIDLGFDFIRPDSGGMRFFFRITPEFHKNGTTVPIGFIWQIWNWRVFSKK